MASERQFKKRVFGAGFQLSLSGKLTTVSLRAPSAGYWHRETPFLPQAVLCLDRD